MLNTFIALVTVLAVVVVGGTLKLLLLPVQAVLGLFRSRSAA